MREVLEEEAPAMPSTSDADLAASLTALLRRWHPAFGKAANGDFKMSNGELNAKFKTLSMTIGVAVDSRLLST
jgi:hypothetical protein